MFGRVLVVAVFALFVGCGGDVSGNDPGSSGTCSASNCTGCCYNGACQAGTTAAACGKNGAACVACSTNQVCRADQTCGVDPESNWVVQPTSAEIAPDNNGSDWDGDGSPPDVIVNSWCPATASSGTATGEVESYTPTWTSGGCTAKAKQLLADGYAFQMWDSDAFSNDTITSPLKVTLTEENFTAGTITLQSSGGMKSLTLKLTKE